MNESLGKPAATASLDDGAEDVTLSAVLRLAVRFGLECWRSRRVFAINALITVPCGLFLSFCGSVEYTASTRILPYSSSRTSPSALSGLAGLAGLSLPGTYSGQVIAADLYPEVAKSFSFMVRLADSPLRFRDGTWTYQTYFATVHRQSGVDLLKRYTIGLPGVLFGNTGRAEDAGLLTQAATDSAASRLPHYSAEFIGGVNGMLDRVVTVMDKKTGIITITATMPDPVAAADLARQTASQLTAAIISYESQKASEQARFLFEQQALAEARYRATQRSLADFQDRNRSLLSPSAQIEFQRLQYEFSLAFEVYKNLSSQLEAAKVKEKEDTPVLTVLDPSMVPNGPSAPRKKRILLVAGLLAVLAACGIVAVRQALALRFIS